jgi:hypothetical protein
MNEDELHAANLAYIRDPAVRTAYAEIIQRLRRSGLIVSVLETSSPRPARMYTVVEGEERYVFSCNRARGHLSFYIRLDALELWPHLAAKAAATFTHTRKQGGQTVVVLRDLLEAQKLIEWLLAECGWDRPQRR